MSSAETDAGRDVELLRECIRLAARARGRTVPNPMVGAVVVRDGEVVGRAYHRRAGEPHAERLALDEAGEAARDGVLYTNVEPCCHHGRTPPCVDAIVEAGIRRVVSCMRDPDPRVDGKGFEALRAAGVEVCTGLLAEEAAELNEGYLEVKRSGRPFVIGKAALSLDGRLATRTGKSQWITGAEARALAHRIRASVDAVVVGRRTQQVDDPRLTAREASDEDGAGPRFRVVVDSAARTPTDARLLSGEDGEAVVIVTERAPAQRVEALRAAGARVLVAPADATGRVSLPEALRALADLGVTRVLLEGGGELLTSAFELGIIDKVVLFYAPLLIGGSDAPSLWSGRGHADLQEAPRLHRVRFHRLGADWAVEGYLHAPVAPS